MNKLKNAPLLEVIFEIRWDMNDDDWMKYPYLHGDLYANMKNTFPLRELLIPPEVPRQLIKGQVQYRFRTENSYPLFQLGPGILTFNTTDEQYEWKDYNKNIANLLDCFFTVNEFSNKKYQLSLSYFDFLKIDPLKINVMEYISKYLNIDISQNIVPFENNPHDFNLRLSYKIDPGILNFQINLGKKSTDIPGLILQTQVNSSGQFDNKTNIKAWLDTAHDFTSMFFKKMTRGELYASFNQ